jgi:CheY-like chemotaxis protein
MSFIQCHCQTSLDYYDLALLDMRMSKMYGHELYEEMKKTYDIVGLVSLNGGLRL